jgi:MerR HTH family regulatory protein
VASRAGKWRIDELAQRSGVGVDTIRFYAREGLLPPAEREGRSLRYGNAHLERLRIIKELQQVRHFTLAGIKELVLHDRLDLLDRLLEHPNVMLSYGDLVEQSGLSPEFVSQLRELGFLTEPEQRGGIGFDLSDLAALKAIGRLLEAGMPAGVVLIIAKIYLTQMRSLNEQLVKTFGGDTDLTSFVSPVELEAFFERAITEIRMILSQIDVLIEYLHRRTIAHLVIRAIEGSALEGRVATASSGAPPFVH